MEFVTNWSNEAIERLHGYEDKYSSGEYFSAMVGRDIVKYSKKFMPKGSAVFDYGCGPGFLLSELCKSGYKTTGMDFTHKSVDIANEKLQGDGNFEGAYYFENLPEGKKYDVIFCVEVIEHLSDMYLDDMFSKFRKLLNGGGSNPNYA